MPLIRNDAVVGTDPWVELADDQPPPPQTPIIVSARRLRREGLALREVPVGVRLEADDDPGCIAAELPGLSLVALSFPRFSDGRPFSLARLLRQRHGYAGELRAVGDLLPDQFPHLRRCGFDAIALPDHWPAASIAEMLARHGACGPDADGAMPALARLRRTAPPAPEPAPVRAAGLNERFAGLPAEDLLALAIAREFKGRIALVSSFGSQSAVLLHMLAGIDRATPVLFIDSGRLFAETIRYRDTLVARLQLTDVRTVGPDPAALAAADPQLSLFRSDPDTCCQLRKVAPLATALAGFGAWITGRKRADGGLRANLAPFEAADGRVKLNPLAAWTPAEVEAYLEAHALPRHPLAAAGYASLGCAPCTEPVAPGEHRRAGRWRGVGKTECGIHLAGECVATV